ncbi:hypothetical protein WYH_01744 [Croceibacterium atlanticum]|uniref:Uncharacterized protein n=1 Tax=Croceibacterium atlanticum TaxID=1267766 RepID=A0A0F7KVJ5_9SPHN|nr:hypothetical protein WYH_01744 [Croceibacterium atlanticum]
MVLCDATEKWLPSHLPREKMQFTKIGCVQPKVTQVATLEVTFGDFQ